MKSFLAETENNYSCIYAVISKLNHTAQCAHPKLQCTQLKIIDKNNNSKNSTKLLQQEHKHALMLTGIYWSDRIARKYL